MSWPSATAALPFALCFYPHFPGATLTSGGSVHSMRSVLIRANRALQSSERSLLVGDGPSSQSRSRLWIRSACGHEKPRRSPLHLRVAAVCLVITPPSSASLQLRSAPSPQFSLSRHVCAPARIVQRIVDLPTNPQPMQEHRELSRHSHRRPLLGALGSP